MLPEQQQRIMGYFIEEAKDHLNTIEQGLLNLPTTIQDSEKANELFRAAHSVKGGAAMLGLESIQRTAHRMEDYFKILKESPVQVDRTLETMFLRISDGLKDLLEQLEGPFGLTPDKAQEIMAGVEPVFGQLETHLESLIDESSAQNTADRHAAPTESLSSLSTPEALQTSFKYDVAALLRQLLSTFKLDDNLKSRKVLQEICAKLVAVGEQFELTEWCDLAETARIAVGELSNDYRKLAPVLIKEIKKAQEMVLTGRASEVAISEAMQALLPEDPLSEGGHLVSAEAVQKTDSSASSESTAHEATQDELADLFGESDDKGLFDSLLDTESADEFEGLFDSPSTDELSAEHSSDNFLSDNLLSDSSSGDEESASNFQTDSHSSEQIDELFSETPVSDEPIRERAVEDIADSDLGPVNRLSVELEFDEIPSELSTLNRDMESEEKADESLDALLATVNVTGPDIGTEELNSLADLFDGDLEELDNTLGGQAFVSEEMRLNPEGIDSTTEEDLTGLFAEDVPEEAIASTHDVSELEDEDLFGGTLTDGEFVALDDSFIDSADLDALSISADAAKETIDEGSASIAEEGENDFGDLWNDEDLFGESSLETRSAAEPNLADDFAEEISLDDGSTELAKRSEDAAEDDPSNDMFSLTEDVWAEAEPNAEVRSQPNSNAASEAGSSEQETDELDDSSWENSLDELDSLDELPDVDSTGIDSTGIDSLLEESLVEDLEEEDALDNQASSDAYLETVQRPYIPSLTEKLIEAKSVTPRELDIEFPTLTGVKLQEAEEDIDSFFVGRADADALSEDLEADNPWDEFSSDLLTMPEESENDDLSFESSFDEETQQYTAEDALEIAAQSNDADSDEGDLAEIFTDSSESPFDAVSEIEEAGSELDALLEVSDEPAGVPMSEIEPSDALSDKLSDDLSDDLWGDLEAASDSLEAQSEGLDLSLSYDISDTALEESDAIAASESDFMDSDFSEAAEEALLESAAGDKTESVRELDAVEEESAKNTSETVLPNEEEHIEIDSTLEDDFLTIEPSTSDANDLDLEASGNTGALSEADLLDFDTAFGLGLTETDESLDEAAADSQDEDLLNARDLPTFSGDLDEFSDAADGETTISDISGLRLEDAELDSLLGLDFETDTGEQARKKSLEDDGQADESIDSSVIEAFSDIDDLFGEETLPAEVDSLSVAPQSHVDEDNFFGSANGNANAEIADESGAEDFADFDELDSLLSEGADSPMAGGFSEEATSESPIADADNFDDLERLLEDGDASGEPHTRRITTRAPRRSSNTREQNMRVSVSHLDNLSNLVGELVVNRNTLERDQERLRQFLDNLLFQVQQLNDVGQRLRDLYERSLLESSLMSSKRPTAAMGNAETAESDHATGATFDALEMDRFTGFHSLSQEMIELIVRVRESSSDIGYTVESSDQVTRQFRQITTQLQEGLNTARMVAFSQAADRLPRAVRDISLKCGKEAQLVVEGQDTLIDKMLVEHLYDPLTHLINNAITHGIEMPETRTAAGKPSEGKITVRAFYQGNQTVIYVADDGGGIDTQFVQRKAIEKGLISQAEAEELSDIETYDLLFHAGFSTRDQADDFAGRGVGMDVVRTSLAEIRGSITIDSELGRGTSFTIRLPLTLSISKALSCVSNQARIAFPMDGVEDMLDVPRDRVVKNDQDQDCVRWRDTVLPFQPVTDLLKFNRTLGRGRVYGGSQEDDILSVIVLRNANTYVAVQVDQVIGEEEIVIKQLEGPVPKPLGIAGATVLGDGRVMPIADVLELIDIAMGRVRREPASMMWAQDGMAAVEETPVKSEPTVLIVDDSITVRELLSMSFNKVGYRVEQARDGQEAWDKLRSGLPCDLVFCDIEMPRMDGLELLSRMQKDTQLKRVPIAMLTSRGADRHRQMAVDLGASGYFTKPYLEEALLDAAQRMLNGESLEKGRGG